MWSQSTSLHKWEWWIVLDGRFGDAAGMKGLPRQCYGTHLAILKLINLAADHGFPDLHHYWAPKTSHCDQIMDMLFLSSSYIKVVYYTNEPHKWETYDDAWILWYDLDMVKNPWALFWVRISVVRLQLLTFLSRVVRALFSCFISE